jgi:hypothetical protein
MRLLKLVSGLTAAVFAVGAGGAARPKVHVLGHANPGGGYSADVYAHRGFAYLSSWTGLKCPSLGVRVYSLAKPRSPRLVATFANVASDDLVHDSWTEKTIVKSIRTNRFAGDLAVTSFQRCRGTNGLQGFGLYDVSSPAHPKKLSIVHLEPRGSHEIWLARARQRAWVYTAIPHSEDLSDECKSVGTPGFRIFDVTDPRRPREVGAWGAWRNLGISPCRRPPTDQIFVHSVITNASATRAFVSYWNLGTVILDIRDPAHPRYLGRTQHVGGGHSAHSAAVSPDGRLLIETHEEHNGAPILYDVSNPRRPVRLATFRPPRRVYTASGPLEGFENGVHDPKLLGHRAYFSWYGLGVVVADVSDPRHPRFLTRFLPRPSPDPDRNFCPAGGCTLTWGVFPTRRYVLSSDMLGGLWVVRVR